MWLYTGQARPQFADAPGSGQESVWDYPRPPVLRPDARQVRVRANGQTIASTTQAIRVLETASPPTFYIPAKDVEIDHLSPAPGQSICEWKGAASYWQLNGGGQDLPVAWSYPRPLPEFAALENYLSFFPGRLECYVDGQRVRPQPGAFYGGWVTDELVGPFKGEPGTEHW